ncbi:DUF2244 domain-containing protein [Citromicrobium bathyomarinum]|uniref:DUF2244 domain-containing protein n=1 Tax=Citromicrobium bathyomarinum TaxID=72174 RepID=UPI00315AE71A
MFSIHSCPGGQPLAEESVRFTHDADLILHLRENRSQLSQEARATFTVLIGLFMAMAILPAIKGDMLVPIFALGTMALLVGALEWHSRSQPDDEWLAIGDDRLRWRSNGCDPVDLPARATRLVQDDASPACLRLFLENHWQRIEIGRCLSLEEKRAVAPLIARQLGEVCA